jgi:hypothetical protein
MKIYVANSPALSVVTWLRRHATALIVVALVALATLGAGVAQALYSNSAPRTLAVGSSARMSVALDQHERHLLAR